MTQMKIVAVDLLRTFGRLNDDIRLNRLVTTCQSSFAQATSEESDTRCVWIVGLLQKHSSSLLGS